MLLPGLVVEADWLATRLSDLRVVDARWYLEKHERDGAKEFLEGHIPGAVHLDLSSDLSDHSSPLRNTLARPECIASCLASKGIGPEEAVVVYDEIGFSACRVAWILSQSGQGEVAVLNGGLTAWKDLGYDLEAGAGTAARARLRPVTAPGSGAMLELSELERRLEEPGFRVVDARSAERFGDAEEHDRHIPGSVNLHYTHNFVPGTARFRPEAELRALYSEHGLLEAGELVSTCGSGVTACITIWTLRRLGRPDARLYDGAWDEWSRRGELARPSEDTGETDL
jgi:thiosulfate/3-mercaptopyruvate sulfurtransferase